MDAIAKGYLKRLTLFVLLVRLTSKDQGLLQGSQQPEQVSQRMTIVADRSIVESYNLDFTYDKGGLSASFNTASQLSNPTSSATVFNWSTMTITELRDAIYVGTDGSDETRCSHQPFLKDVSSGIDKAALVQLPRT